jgi:alpha-beta hydrolase superfamily lysophospholipase
MNAKTSSFVSSADGTQISSYAWADVAGPPAGVVQIAHGLAEHGARYARFAKALNAAGFLVHAVDHRGHGRSAAGRLGDFGPAGFAGLIADVAQFGAALRAQHGNLPLFLFGHSMGSFAAQAALVDHASTWSGVVLSGSTALDAFAAAMARRRPTRPPGWRPSTPASNTAPATSGCRATPPRSMPTSPTPGAAGTSRTT